MDKKIVKDYMFNFEFNSYRIDRKYYPEIEKLAELMKKDPTLKIEIQGYTDNIGEAKYNVELSKKRAEAVKKLLVNKFHIDANRIKTVGYGMSNPIADNSTPEGQAKNRRVVVLNITHREETKGSDMLEGETINSETNSSEAIDDEEKQDLPVNFVK
jgi:OOP family OmpA-OmpF porin